MSSIDDEELTPAAEAAMLRSKATQRQRERIITETADWVWCSEAQAFVRRTDRLIWSDRQWRSHYAHLDPKGNIVLTVQRRKGLISKFERLVYEPGGTEVIDDVSFNLWRAGGIEARAGDVAWFIDHITYLFPDPQDAALVLDYLALLVREPWTKILFALLIWSREHGVGKSVLALLIARMIGEHNTVFPTNEEVTGKFTSWQEGAQLVVLEELMMRGRLELANRLKPVITQPTIRIRAMYRSEYEVPNRLNLIAFSNYSDALKVDDGDRRWLIVEAPVKPRSPDYYSGLFGHVDNDDDVAAVKHFLQNRLVGLNPKGRAPETAAKVEMIEQGLPDEEAYVLNLFEAEEPPFDFGLVRLEEVVTAAQQKFRGYRGNLMSRMTSLLKDRIGAVRQTRNTTPGDGRPKWHLWSVRDHDYWRELGPSARMDAYLKHLKNSSRHAYEQAVADFEGWPGVTEHGG
jgi:hypothetical protein